MSRLSAYYFTFKSTGNKDVDNFQDANNQSHKNIDKPTSYNTCNRCEFYRPASTVCLKSSGLSRPVEIEKIKLSVSIGMCYEFSEIKNSKQ